MSANKNYIWSSSKVYFGASLVLISICTAFTQIMEHNISYADDTQLYMTESHMATGSYSF